MKYLNAPCDNCPFLKKGGVQLRRARIEGILDGLKDFSAGRTFSCHKTVKHDRHEEIDEWGLVADHTPGEGEAHCGGALIFMDKQRWSIQMVRIAERLGIYDPSKTKASAKKLVFDTEEQFLAAATDAKEHKKRQKRRKRRKLKGTGEPCSVGDDDCEHPAGWDNGNIVENKEADAPYECVECGQPVCGNCSTERKGKRVCAYCAEEEAA